MTAIDGHPPLSFRPAPQAAPTVRMLLAQTRTELLLTLRRGESVLLTMVIPLGLLLVFTLLPVVTGPKVGASHAARAAFFVPGIVALAIMSTAFTGQAISTGYERQYGVLKRLGATALPRWVLLVAKTLAVCAVELIQLVLVLAVGAALGWRPHGSAPGTIALVLLGTAAFSGLGLLMAGVLRAEVTLAAANLVWFALLVFGGVLFPTSYFGPDGALAAQALPTGALAEGLRATLSAPHGGGVPWREIGTLAGWAVAGLAAAARAFRWE